MPDGAGALSLHHIGCVVASIEESIESYGLTLGAVAVSGIFEDPIPRSRVAFPDFPTHGLAQFGLFSSNWVQPAAARAPLVRSPKPAVAFGGRRIAWMRTSEALLIEYLERFLPEPTPA